MKKKQPQNHNPILDLIYNLGQSSESLEIQRVLPKKEQILSLSSVWEVNAQSFHILATHALLEYVKQDVDGKEIAAFKSGLAALPGLLAQCFNYKISLNAKKIDETDERA